MKKNQIEEEVPEEVIFKAEVMMVGMGIDRDIQKNYFFDSFLSLSHSNSAPVNQ